MDPLAFDFMRRALAGAALSGLIAPAIGAYIVQRRLSLLGDGLGHVAILGVGLAMATGWAPMPVAIAVCVAGAVLVELLRQFGKTPGDVGLAMLFYGGLAAGVMMAGMAGQGAGALSSYLFGSLTTLSGSDLVTIGVLGVVVLVPTLAMSPQLFAITADEDHARVQGMRVRLANLAVVVLAAVTVTVSMRTVGLLLVSAMMVTPVATSHNLFVGFKTALFAAMGIGAATAIAGTMGAYYMDTPAGATIVVAAIALFGLSLPLGSWLANRRGHLAHIDSAPPSEHIVAEEDCRHPDDGLAVVHGDHIDYIHDGHRHARHGDHFDEH